MASVHLEPAFFVFSPPYGPRCNEDVSDGRPRDERDAIGGVMLSTTLLPGDAA